EPALGGRLVALKVSLKGGAEAKTLGRLNHPHIVPVHSVQQDAATRFTVVCMPYLGSATLCDVIDHTFAGRTRPAKASAISAAIAQVAARDEALAVSPAGAGCPWKGAYVDGVLQLGVQLAEALAFIHGLGIAHRDLKPSNVLMSSSGLPMLLDFNLSHDGRAHGAGMGGTLPYMSPQQLFALDQARPQTASADDSRADLYALGVILFELLSGVHPFGPISLKLSEAESVALLLERQKRGPRSLRTLNPHVDRPLARLIERCLAYETKDRPQSAAELAAL